MNSETPNKKRTPKIRNNTKSIGILDAAKHNSLNLRMKTKAILLTGGLLVKKEGFMSVRKDGFGSNYKKKYVILEEGMLKIFDRSQNKAKKTVRTNPKKLIVSSQQRREVVERDNRADCLIEVGQLKSIEYIKRNGKNFEITWRPGKSRKSFKSVGGNSQASKTSRYSTLSRAFGVTRNRSGSDLGKNRESQRHFSLLNPLTWVSQSEKTIHFKLENGSVADEWVQSILYELKNQAVCIGEAIATQERSIDHMQNISKLENLHRFHVDLWALAKGKISIETRHALKMFVEFLENQAINPNLDEEASQHTTEELAIWKQTLGQVGELVDAGVNTIDTGHEVASALEEIQILNEEAFHIGRDSLKDFQTFRTTNRILNPGNEATPAHRQTGSFLYNLRKTRKVSKTNKIELDLDDIVLLEPEMKQKTVELKDNFPSAIDVKREQDAKVEAKLIASIKQSSGPIRGKFLEQATTSGH